MKAAVFSGITVSCCQECGECICGTEERVLRAYIREEPNLPAMSKAQREWCLHQIASVEGYTRSDFEGECDGGVARGVLDAWRDYCRDKGLL